MNSLSNSENKELNALRDIVAMDGISELTESEYQRYIDLLEKVEEANQRNRVDND